MGEKEQRSKEDLRKDTKRRTVSDRRESILHYELLNYAKPDSRSQSGEAGKREGLIKD